MRLRPIVGSLGTILKLFSFTFLVPILVSLRHEEAKAVLARWEVAVPFSVVVFGGCFLGTLVVGAFLEWAGGKADFRDYEGYIIVALGWAVLPFPAAIPFWVMGTTPTFLDALYESVSGLTTTGFTVLPLPLEAHVPSILFWRSFIQWVGGGGIIVLVVAVLSKVSESGGRLMRAELSGGQVTRLKPKIAQTAKTLWGVYMAVTLAGFVLLFAILLWRTDLGLEEAAGTALVYEFSGIATGGYAPFTANAGQFNDPWFETALALVMLSGATSFVLIYQAARGSPSRLFRDPEWRFFLLIVLLSVAIVTFNIMFVAAYYWGSSDPAVAAMGLSGQPWQVADLWKVLRYSFHNVVSVATTTGYFNTNYDLWPEGSKLVLLVLMLVGGCLGSTVGAIKVGRILVLVKIGWRELQKLVHPRAIIPLRVAGNVVDEETVRGVVAMFFLYLMTFLTATLIFTFGGYTVIESAGLSAASLGGVGTAFANAGPAGYFLLYPEWVKVVSMVLMWLGRLEIVTALILFFPATYQR